MPLENRPRRGGARCLMLIVAVALLFAPMAARAAKSVVITATGDITIGGDPRRNAPASEKYYSKLYTRYGGGFLSRVRGVLRGGLTIVNLESCLTTENRHADKSYVLRAKPAYASVLSKAGVDVVGHANNHTFDFGTTGALDTRRAVMKHRMSYVSGGVSAIRTANGIRVGFCAFNPTGGDVTRVMQAEIKALKNKCDVIVASFHWGTEFRYSVSGAMRSLGRAAVDAGADLVVGHHSHVVSGIEIYKGRTIAYGLGTLSSCLLTPKDMDTVILQQQFVRGANGAVKPGKLKLIPCSMSSSAKVNDARPRLLKGKDRKRVLSKVQQYSKSVDASVFE